MTTPFTPDLLVFETRDIVEGKGFDRLLSLSLQAAPLRVRSEPKWMARVLGLDGAVIAEGIAWVGYIHRNRVLGEMCVSPEGAYQHLLESVEDTFGAGSCLLRDLREDVVRDWFLGAGAYLEGRVKA